MSEVDFEIPTSPEEELEEALCALTQKQRQFVECYFTHDYNGTRAIIAAGYNSTNPRQLAWETRKKPKVKKAMMMMAKLRAEEMRVKPEYIIRKIVSALETAELEGNHVATLRAAELLARHAGMFIERQEISGKDGQAIRYEEVQNEAADFTRAISRLAKRDGAQRANVEAVPRSVSKP
jgi:phage terminase small subunit